GRDVFVRAGRASAAWAGDCGHRIGMRTGRTGRRRSGHPPRRTDGRRICVKPPSRNHLTDVPRLLVGNADDGRTGCTVVTADGPFVAASHVMGGAPGTRETDLLAP